ncbi:hypothetical protein AtDm6_2363 [Acetobacter tropicalis]|uniref:Uncharacterized protein n=1 Tax=Acetobacter tropicalis TaxID=104102 RepID=A0A094YLY6_9PROT|nr:hypothetical protein AtDm6_2363 [Acetobacter tropicalis]
MENVTHGFSLPAGGNFFKSHNASSFVLNKMRHKSALVSMPIVPLPSVCLELF